MKRGTLWQEIRTIQKNRNQLVHRAQLPSKIQVNQAVDVAVEVVEVVTPGLVGKFGFYIKTDCKDIA